MNKTEFKITAALLQVFKLDWKSLRRRYGYWFCIRLYLNWKIKTISGPDFDLSKFQAETTDLFIKSLSNILNKANKIL